MDTDTRNGLPVFAENVGVIPDMTDKEPDDYYRLFVTDGLLQNVLDETNRYGEQSHTRIIWMLIREQGPMTS